MKEIMTLLIWISATFFLLCTSISATAAGNAGEDRDDSGKAGQGWKAGVASVNITPQAPMWMAGYGNRDRPSEGKLHDLWAKALAFEDESGNQSILFTTDLLGFPKGMSDSIRDRIESEYGLSRSQIILNSSHTHTAPVLQDALVDIYPLDDEQSERIGEYSRRLEGMIVRLAGEALNSLEPVRLYAENGVTRFQVNRRNNDASALDRQTSLKGPNDHAVPVIKAENESGELIAVAFGYACHPTVLSDYNWSGDYPGFAQLELEKAYPGATALFFQGAGADQNPLPRRSVALARQYGQELAAAVMRVLDEDMRELYPELATAYTEIDLSFSRPPTAEELSRVSEESAGYQKRWADRMGQKLERGESFITSYPYPLQVWRLGELPVMTLGGELVIEYATELKKIFGTDIFVMGYSNDVMTYIPTATILREGGYEGASAHMVYGLPATWSSGVETDILHEIVRLAEEAGVPKYEY
ncbi:MAG: neutral/alkaline non-lysosomal ceramidase N-terminal domain-containing protein [Balneolaceae bacterium]